MADPGYIDLPSSTHFTYEYNQNWSASNGTAIGAWLRDTAERDYAAVSAWFNNLTPAGLPFKVRIDTAPNPLDANAWNDGFKNITLNLGPLISTDFDRARGVLVAEFIEIFMVSQNAGWIPGFSHGEALSRFASFTLYPNIAAPWKGPNNWLNSQPGDPESSTSRPDWVSNTYPNDREPIPVGCGLLFLYYLNSQLGYTADAIVQAASSTLEGVYQGLTNASGGFGASTSERTFAGLLASKFPPGVHVPDSMGSINPFPIPWQVPSANYQTGWWWCMKCQGMHFLGPGSGQTGSCPAGGIHSTTGSAHYKLVLNDTQFSGQSNWRWCYKCSGLHFAGSGLGPCPHGGSHSTDGSGQYTLALNDPQFPGQHGWHWCNRCQGLFFAGSQPGACPANGGGGTHNGAGSGEYRIAYESPSPSTSGQSVPFTGPGGNQSGPGNPFGTENPKGKKVVPS